MPEPALHREDATNIEPEKRLGGDDPFLTLPVDQAGCRPFLEVNTRLSRFHIKEHLGRGSLGDVYLAQDMVSDETVAIKVVVNQNDGGKGGSARLRGERTAYSRIQDHHHILKVHDLHPVPKGGAELLVLSMEYADGGTFRDWLKESRHAPEIRRTHGIDHFKDLCRGVAAGEEAGVPHLDLKPENCLLVKGVWKVSDFGGSTFVECNENGGCVSGTPAYMSPEHFLTTYPEDLDSRSDIYSLGIMLFELLHPRGRQPFSGTFEELRRMHLESPLPPLPSAEPWESRVIKRCLQKDPALRYQSVLEMVNDLDGRRTARCVDMERRQVIEAAWQEACISLDENRFEDAKRLCDQILEFHPEHAHAVHLRKTLMERLENAGNLYNAIEQGFEMRGFDELGALLQEAVDLYPNHPHGHIIQKKLEIKAKHFREAMEEGVHCFGRGDFDDALFWFEKARRLNPGGQAVEHSVRNTSRVIQEISETRLRIDRVAAAGNQRKAIALARALDKFKDRIRNTVIQHEEGPHS